MAQVMLFTCTREENALLSAMRSVTLFSTERLNRFLSNLASQTGSSSAVEAVQQVLDGEVSLEVLDRPTLIFVLGDTIESFVRFRSIISRENLMSPAQRRLQEQRKGSMFHKMSKLLKYWRFVAL
jgi:hypothetical protein